MASATTTTSGNENNISSDFNSRLSASAATSGSALRIFGTTSQPVSSSVTALSGITSSSTELTVSSTTTSTADEVAIAASLSALAFGSKTTSATLSSSTLSSRSSVLSTVTHSGTGPLASATTATLNTDSRSSSALTDPGSEVSTANVTFTATDASSSLIYPNFIPSNFPIETQTVQSSNSLSTEILLHSANLNSLLLTAIVFGALLSFMCMLITCSKAGARYELLRERRADGNVADRWRGYELEDTYMA